MEPTTFVALECGTGGGELTPPVAALLGGPAVLDVVVRAIISPDDYGDGQPADRVRYRWTVDALRQAADRIEAEQLRETDAFFEALRDEIRGLPETTEGP